MDPQTQQVIAGIAIFVVLGAIAISLWNWRLMRSAARRRFNPRNRVDRSNDKRDDDDGQCNCKRGGCNCPDPVGPMCVAAKVNVRDDVPHAIYGLSSDECCNDGRMTARQAQLLVNRYEKLRLKKQDAELNALLADLAKSD